MNCAEVQKLKHAHADGELDLVRSLEIEQHLNDCGTCFDAIENVRTLQSALKSDDLYFQAPSRLRRQIRASLRGQQEQEPRGTPFWRKWMTLALPAGAMALIVLLLMPGLIGSSADERLAAEITSGHVRSLLGNQQNHLIDVVSSDPHTVKPWFVGKLDFAPPVKDPAEQGFPLIGGRLEYVQDRQVAALVYQRYKHFINLFIWPATPGSSTTEKLAVRQGYNLVHWSDSGMTYWAVSDLNAAELKDFAHLIK